MGLLSMFQDDPEKLAALQQGLISMGTTMMAGGRQDFGAALGQGMGAGVKSYNEKFEEARKKALAMAPYKAAMTPAKPAVPGAYKVGGQSLPKLGDAQNVAQNMYNLPQGANPYKPPEQDMTGEALGMPASLMPQGMGIEDFGGGQAAPIEEVAAQEATPASFDRQKYLDAVIAAGPDHPLFMEANKQMLEQRKPIVLGKSLIDPDTNKVIATDETWREEQDIARKQKIEELNMRLDDKRVSREESAALRRELAGEQAALRRDLASQSSADRRMIASMASADRRAAGQGGNGGRPMSVTLQKELLESDDTVQSSRNVVGTLNQALEINKKGYSGYLAKPRAVLRSNLPGQSEGADATINLDNMMTGQALESLKSTFGAMPTEGERKILLDMQASADKTPRQREDIIKRAITAAQRREQYAAAKANSIRDGSYLSRGAPVMPPPPAAPKSVSQLPTKPPAGVDPKVWQHMTPAERKLWK